MRPLRLLLSSLVVVLVAGCASGPNISAQLSPGVDLTNFETFNYLPRLGTDRENGTRTPLSNRLIEAMNHEMSMRGLRLSDRPDLLVDFNFFAQERIDVRSTPSTSRHSVRYSHWSRRYSVWPTYQTTVRQYTEGTFLVDLIDVNNATLIGEAAASGRMRQELRDFDQDQVNQVMSDIMNQLLPAL